MRIKNFKTALVIALITIAVMALYTPIIAIAQDAAGAATDAISKSPDKAWYLVLYNTLGGTAISFAVAFLKRWQIVNDHPKATALILSFLATIIPILAGFPFAASGPGMVIVGLLTQLLSATGTHEWISKPLGKMGEAE